MRWCRSYFFSIKSYSHSKGNCGELGYLFLLNNASRRLCRRVIANGDENTCTSLSVVGPAQRLQNTAAGSVEAPPAPHIGTCLGYFAAPTGSQSWCGAPRTKGRNKTPGGDRSRRISHFLPCSQDQRICTDRARPKRG